MEGEAYGSGSLGGDEAGEGEEGGGKEGLLEHHFCGCFYFGV